MTEEKEKRAKLLRVGWRKIMEWDQVGHRITWQNRMLGLRIVKGPGQRLWSVQVKGEWHGAHLTLVEAKLAALKILGLLV